MALTLTATLNNLSKETTKEPQIILEIDGCPIIFGASDILSLWKFDDGLFFDEEGLFFDQPFADPNSRDYISLKQTTKNISQQVLPDKSGTGSISTAIIDIVDINQEVTQIFGFGNYFDELLGRDATLYVSFSGASHPEDSLPVLSGYIDDYKNIAGSFLISISHPENLKRQEIFVPYNSKSTEALIYKDLLVQNIYWEQRDKDAEPLKIEYVSGGSLQAEYLTVNNSIRITITGTETADEIKNHVEDTSVKINEVAKLSIVGDGATVQTTYPLTTFFVQTEFDVETTTGLLDSQDNFTSYIRMNDEVMKVISYTETSIEVERNIKGTPQSHGPDTTIDSVYNIQDDPVTMALKIYLSDKDKKSFGDGTIKSINQITTTLYKENSIYLEAQDVERDYGIIENDIIILSGTLSDGEYNIVSIENIDTGQIITVDGALTTEIEATGAIAFRSQFNVYPDGLAMTNREVDVQGHIDELTFNPNTFPQMEFELVEEINGKDFVDKELYYPNSLYSVPRKAKVSLKLVKPPLSLEETVVLDEENILNMEQVKVSRSTHKFMYNNILYKYEKDLISDKFLTGKLFVDNNSLERIGAGRIIKQLKIESNGLRDNAETDNLILRQTQRLFDRYKNAAQMISNVSVLYGTGLSIEIGDIVVFGSETMPLSDLSTGERIFKPRFVEVINKSLDITTGRVKLDLLETAYDLEARYGIIGFSSVVDAGSSTDRIKLKQSYYTGDYDIETDKYTNYIGQRLWIHNDDYTYSEIRTLLQIDPANQDYILLQTPLPTPPAEGYIVEPPLYAEGSSEIDSFYKDQFCYLNGTAEIVNGIDTKTFEVSDSSDLQVGYLTYIHSDDYTRDSFPDGESRIVDIIGNVVYLESDINFVPQSGDKMKLVGYKDGGAAYRIY